MVGPLPNIVNLPHLTEASCFPSNQSSVPIQCHWSLYWCRNYLITVDLHPYNRASPDNWQRCRVKQRWRCTSCYMGLILLEGGGLCVSGQNGCICDNGLWILDEEDRRFLNLFYFLCFSFLASAFVTHHWFIIGREGCRRHYAVNICGPLPQQWMLAMSLLFSRGTWEPGFIFYLLTWPPCVVPSHSAEPAWCVLHRWTVCISATLTPMRQSWLALLRYFWKVEI